MSEELENEEVSTSEELSSSPSTMLDQSQFDEISSSLEDISSYHNNLAGDVQSIGSDLSSTNTTLSAISSTLSSMSSSASASSTVETPEDYYTLMCDLNNQQTFFLSLILGVLICYLFICNFVK